MPRRQGVAIIGVGQTIFGERWEASFRDLVTEAGFKSIQDARVSGEEIDAVYVGSMGAGQYIGQEHIAALVVDHAGFSAMHTPATRVEGSGASGALAFRHAVLAVMSGTAEVAIAGGIEKMTDVSESRAARIRGSSLDQEWEAFVGATDAALHALMAKAYMAEHGAGVDALEAVAVKNHAHGTKNPFAMFQRETTAEAVRAAPMVADPFTTLHCAALSDGAAAAIVCPLDRAESYTKKPVLVAGIGQGSDTLALHNRASLVSMPAARRAAERAYKQASCGPKDIQVAEVHDAYTINELIALEDLGLTDRGDAARATLDGETRLGGTIPVNPSGGLKARGHPVGATGLAQIAEIALQMRGDGGARQVKDARRGLAHNTGGTGATAVVTVLEAV